MWECDDGNTKNGDGCDSSCNVEIGWYCFDGSIVTRDICRLLPRPIVTSIFIDTNNTLVTMYFNESIILKDYWNETNSMEVYVDGPKGPYDLVWYIVDSEFYKNETTTKLEIAIELTD